jgi:hypothetical protein
VTPRYPQIPTSASPGADSKLLREAGGQDGGHPPELRPDPDVEADVRVAVCSNDEADVV